MVAPRITCLVDARAQVGEGPVWDPVDEVLWWTDINGRRMHRFDPRGGRDEAFEMDIRVGCFALRAGGGMILAAEHGFWSWTPGIGKPEHLLDVEADRPENRMNDGGCDRAGNLFASSMNLADPRRPEAACWRLTPDLRAQLILDGIRIGNGIVIQAGDSRLSAQRMTGNQNTGDLQAEGRVRLEAAGRVWVGDAVGPAVGGKNWFATGSPTSAEATLNENRKSASSSHFHPVIIWARRIRKKETLRADWIERIPARAASRAPATNSATIRITPAFVLINFEIILLLVAGGSDDNKTSLAKHGKQSHITFMFLWLNRNYEGTRLSQARWIINYGQDPALHSTTGYHQRPCDPDRDSAS